MADLILGWPAKALHPNARVHWAVRARAAREARQTAAWATKAAWARLTLPDGPLHLWIDFFPPDRRKRDDDGLLAAFKPHRDGIADALGIDDSRFVSHPMLRHGEVRPAGQVAVRITGGPPCGAASSAGES